MIQPQQHMITSNGNQLSVYEWGAQNAQPSVIFFHATGFHARCWGGVIQHLENIHCIAADASGHGASATPKQAHTWQAYGDDAAHIMQTFGLKGAVAIGHSMGGNSIVRAAAQITDAFASLLLIDPVILPREFYRPASYSIEGHFVLKRRREWSSADEMFNSFKGRGAFARWEDSILRDYCEYGLTLGDEGFVLACVPETEANVYSSSDLAANIDVYDAVAKINQPVRILRCTPFFGEQRDMLASPTAPNLATYFKHAQDFELPDNTHFIPMESPQIVAQHIREMLAALAQ